MDVWPPIRCPRFDGESMDAYERRSAKIIEITTNFRRGQYEDRDIAEQMERILLELRTPALEHNV